MLRQVDARSSLSADKRLWTVQSPSSDTVPAEWLEAGKLIYNRTANGVELFCHCLCKCLLTYGVGLEDTSRSSTSVHNVLNARSLDEHRSLVLTDLARPDVTGGTVLVRRTPCSVTGLCTQIEGNLWGNVGGVEAALVG